MERQARLPHPHAEVARFDLLPCQHASSTCGGAWNIGQSLPLAALTREVTVFDCDLAEQDGGQGCQFEQGKVT